MVLKYIDTLILFILLQHQYAAITRHHDESNFAIDEWWVTFVNDKVQVHQIP